MTYFLEFIFFDADLSVFQFIIKLAMKSIMYQDARL